MIGLIINSEMLKENEYTMIREELSAEMGQKIRITGSYLITCPYCGKDTEANLDSQREINNDCQHCLLPFSITHLLADPPENSKLVNDILEVLE